MTQVPFGRFNVSPAQKTSGVHDIFSKVAQRYDLMNDFMSGGVHRLWKRSFVQQLNPQPHEIILDVAGGTGDIATLIRQRTYGQAQAIICDLTESMLRHGRANRVMPLQYVCGDAQTLPFADNSFDAYTIAFGLRNVAERDKALAEAYRVLKPNGRVFCLEFSHVVLPLLKPFYKAYSQQVIPWLGQLVANDKDSYVYLVESIERFADQQTLCNEFAMSGFSQTAYRNLSGGIAAVHSGIKPC
jgi:demethylmenaquinone methyltransferase / 2-methoxy-6-polyprenyl-1,4-benzoquinol methylase